MTGFLSDQVPALADKLRAPFASDDLEWRVQRSGLKQNGEVWATLTPYITARAVMSRLDDVFGPDGWEVKYRPWESGHAGVMCLLRVRFPGTGWVEREDGAEQPETEPVKGGFSNALKRVAVTLGMGRYLYNCGTIYADISMDRQPGWEKAVHSDKQTGKKTNYWWRVPEDQLRRLTVGAALAPEESRPSPETANSPAAPAKPQEPAAVCPKCGGAMWDNRARKKNPKAPDFRCKAKDCEGIYWPGQWPPKAEDASQTSLLEPAAATAAREHDYAEDPFGGQQDDGLPF